MVIAFKLKVDGAAADVEVAVSTNIKINLGVAVASAGLDLFTAVTEYESVDAVRAKPVTEIVPAVVESDAAPDNVPVPAVVVIVN